MIKLYHGDCLDIMPTLPEHSIDAIIADIPYGTTKCKWDVIIPLDQMWNNIKRLIKPNGIAVLFGLQPFTSVLISSNIKNYKHMWVWEKTRATNFTSAKKQPMTYHEDILVFYGNKYKPIMVDGEPYHTRICKRSKVGENDPIISSSKILRTKRYPSSIIKFKSMYQQRRLHNTQKPIALMEYLIRTYTNEGETVLDFTMGSGSTGVAAKNTNRSFIGIEKDEAYFNIAKSRIDE